MSTASGYLPEIQNVPFSQEAEEAVIGAALINSEAFNAVTALLAPHDFFLRRNTLIWDAMAKLKARGEAIDYLTVLSEVQATGLIEDIGGEHYLLRLINHTPSSSHVEAYAFVVQRAAVRRHLMAAGDVIKGLAMNNTMELMEVIAQSENCIYEATKRHTLLRSWNIVDRAGLMQLPQVEWLIPRVLPCRALGMIFGASGAYKSFYAIHKAIEVAQTANVLYVVAEGESGMQSRVQAHEKHFRMNTARVSYCMGAVDMFSDMEMTAFKRLAAKHQPSLIVVDTFAMCTGDADENNTKEMKQIVEGCKRMINELQCSVLVVHHTNKEGKVERGNQSLRNACDTVIRISLQDDVVKVEQQKSKDKALPSPEYYRAVVVPIGYKDSLGEMVTSVVLEPSDKVISDVVTEKQKQVMLAIQTEPEGSTREIAEITEISVGTVATILQRLMKLNYISNVNGVRTLTPAGKRVIGDSSDSSDSSDSRGVQVGSNHANHTNHSNQSRMFEHGTKDYYQRGG